MPDMREVRDALDVLRRFVEGMEVIGEVFTPFHQDTKRAPSRRRDNGSGSELSTWKEKILFLLRNSKNGMESSEILLEMKRRGWIPEDKTKDPTIRTHIAQAKKSGLIDHDEASGVYSVTREEGSR